MKVDGSYKIVDATWGSGCMKEKKIHKKIALSNLFAQPDFFFKKRLPEDPRWQLREKPIGLRTFLKYQSTSQMFASPSIYYNYVDSIQLFEEAEKQYLQDIITKNSTYKFNPTEANLLELGNCYYQAGYLNSKKDASPEELKIALLFYKKALSTYHKMKNEEEKKELKMSCYKGINYVQYFISKKNQ